MSEKTGKCQTLQSTIFSLYETVNTMKILSVLRRGVVLVILCRLCLRTVAGIPLFVRLLSFVKKVSLLPILTVILFMMMWGMVVNFGRQKVVIRKDR